MEIPVIAVTSQISGTGKTTLVLNLAAALWQDGYHVRLSLPDAETFLQKRRSFCQANSLSLPFPEIIAPDKLFSPVSGENNKQAAIVEIPASANADNIPLLARAHTLLTVINNRSEVCWTPDNEYLNFIWQVKKAAALTGRKYLNWVVTENHVFSDDKEATEVPAEDFARRYGFRLSPALQCREAYRHVADGYCAADMLDFSGNLKMTLADVYARREILQLTDFMWRQK